MRDELTPELEQALNEYGAARRTMPPRNADRAWVAFSGHFDAKKGEGYSARALRRWAAGAGVLTTCALVMALAVPRIWTAITTRTTVPVVHEYATTSRQRATITLPGSVTVVLAPNTTLGVSDNDVTLAGEAVFTVPHSQNNPFTVRTSNSTTRVLGTTFAVRQYADDITARVVVAEGKISVNSAVLSIGDVASVTQDGTPSVTHEANIAALLSWTAGRLVFQRTPLKEVTQQLTRWYGLDVRVSDPALNDVLLTATVDLSASAMNEIQAIAVTLGLRAERKGQIVNFVVERK